MGMGKRTFMERGMKNKRYRKTEEVILKVFFDENERGITMQKMAKKAKIGRSTMYTHHHAIREILPDYERYVLREYGLTMKKKLRKKNISLKSLYLDTLLFILRNKKIFAMFLKFGDREITIKMIGRLEDKVSIAMRFPKNSEKIFRIYASEVAEIIFEWGEKGFSDRELEKILSDIMYLTETSRARLMPINQ